MKTRSLFVLFVLLVLSPLAKAEPGQWFKDMPANKPVTAKVGDSVWALVPTPSGDQADVGVYKIDSVEGNTATLSDKLGTKFPGIPAGFITALGDPAKCKVGSVAIGHAWGAPKVIGRVKGSEAGQVTLRYKWSSSMTDKMMEQAEPMRVGVVPMAWVAYEDNGATYKGLLVAIDGDKTWISNDAGFVVEQAKAKLRPLTIVGDYKEGAIVKAYSWGFGYRPGTVVKVVEPGYLYTVKIAGSDKTEDYSFADLVSKL